VAKQRAKKFNLQDELAVSDAGPLPAMVGQDRVAAPDIAGGSSRTKLNSPPVVAVHASPHSSTCHQLTTLLPPFPNIMFSL
jgi:hypothetical protein